MWPILPSIPNEIQFIQSATQAPDGSLMVVWRLKGDPLGSNELKRVDLAAGLAQLLGFLSDGSWLLAFGPGDRLFGLRKPRSSADPSAEVLFEIDPETAFEVEVVDYR